MCIFTGIYSALYSSTFYYNNNYYPFIIIIINIWYVYKDEDGNLTEFRGSFYLIFFFFRALLDWRIVYNILFIYVCAYIFLRLMIKGGYIAMEVVGYLNKVNGHHE